LTERHHFVEKAGASRRPPADALGWLVV
jgi:hypothetical protein